MSPEELTAFINTYFGSAVDAFTNARMKTVLLMLSTGSLVSTVETGVQFQQMIEDNPDLPIMAYVANDTVYTKDKDVVLWRIPGRGVGQVAIDFITDER
jgi:hypothetical protein